MAPRSSALRVKQVHPNKSSDQPALGRIVGVADQGQALVEVAGRAAPMQAMVSTAIAREQIQAAAATQQYAVLLFINGTPPVPVVVGLIDARRPAAVTLAPRPPPLSRKAPPLAATVDGQRVEITATDEIVLRCGAASITLRSNGRVVVRGAHVETDAQGVNRIKGGTVKIN